MVLIIFVFLQPCIFELMMEEDKRFAEPGKEDDFSRLEINLPNCIHN